MWALLCLVTVTLFGHRPSGSGRRADGPTTRAPYPAKAWILVDADTGKVLEAFNEHEALPPASTQKIMTALVAAEKLTRDSSLTVGTMAAAQAAMRIGMAAGEQWALDHALHSLMMVSANDAAYALAEAASGGARDAFAADMNAAAARYGMVDSRFADPAGFDGAEGFNGGSRVSAYDLAIAARNYLAVPELTAIVGLREYRFDGPAAMPHVLYNHNKLLARYPGATGLKTGYTSLAGNTFVGTATRDGRTMIAVVLNSTNMYGISAALLDQGFATPADAPGLGAVAAARPGPGLPGPCQARGRRGRGRRSIRSVVAGRRIAHRLPRRRRLGRRRRSWPLRRRAERRRRARAERRRRLAAIRRAAYLAGPHRRQLGRRNGHPGSGPIRRRWRRSRPPNRANRTAFAPGLVSFSWSWRVHPPHQQINAGLGDPPPR